MKLFLYALMASFFLIGCESYHGQQQDAGDIQRQEERADDKAATPEAVETKGFPDKGGNAGNK